MAVEVMKDIYRLEIPLPRNPLKALNSYLIRGRERSLLIDTGFNRKECREALLRELGELNVRMEETDIYLTHLHSDHTGLAPEIATDETHVYLDSQDAGYVVASRRPPIEEKENKFFLAAGFTKEELAEINNTHPGRKLAPDRTFERYEDIGDGREFRVGDYVLRAIRVPGHTPGQTILWMEEQKTLFSADHVLFDITPNITRWADFDDALGNYISNLKKIDTLPVERTFPAHRMTGDLHARVAELLLHHEARLAECEGIVKETPGLVACDIAGRMHWDISVKEWKDFPPPQKWFAVGECLSHLDRLLAEGRVKCEQDGVLMRYY